MVRQLRRSRHDLPSLIDGESTTSSPGPSTIWSSLSEFQDPFRAALAAPTRLLTTAPRSGDVGTEDVQTHGAGADPAGALQALG